MKKTIILLFFIGLTVIFFLLNKKSVCKNKQAVSFQLENKSYCLLVADSENEWGKGLMDVEKPVDFDGMIFIFPKKETRSFWNLNTFVDLNVYWLADDHIVGKNFLPSIRKTKKVYSISSLRPVDKVIEIIK